MIHDLKSQLTFFKGSWCGWKKFEIRKNDRNFEAMDEVILKEWDHREDPFDQDSGYTGREIHGYITYISDYEQKPGYVVFSYEETSRTEG